MLLAGALPREKNLHQVTVEKIMRPFLPVIMLLIVGVLLPTAVYGKSATMGAKRQQPNVIVVLVDDLGYADFSSYGNARVQTVNVDRLAAEGLSFARYYMNSPICSPSRTALTTGQYPARWKITSYIDNRALNARRGMAQFLDPAAPTLAKFLSGVRYRTGHFGKWHMGGGRDVGEAPLISAYGFDASLTQFEGLGDRLLPLFDVHDGTTAERAGLGVASERLGRGRITWMDRCQITRAFVDRALEFIKQAEADGRPFYVNLWPDDVHSPFYPPRNLRGDGSKRALYDGVLENMDDQLGPLFDYVRENPALRDNTLIIVASDNGPEPGAGSAGSLRGAKATLYEGGVRGPLIVWGPGYVPARQRGMRNDKTVLSTVDLVASLLRLAGVNSALTGNLDGVDLSAALVGKGAGTRNRPLFWKRPPDRPGPPEDRWPDLAVLDGRWKLLLQEDGTRPQLYDVITDPSESTNLAAGRRRMVERLSRSLLAWNAALPK